MNTKDFLTPTKKYKNLTWTLHAIYRLINTSCDIKDLLIKLTKLLSQITKSENVSILLLTSDKKFSKYRTYIVNHAVKVIEKKMLIKNYFEKKVIRDGLLIKKNNQMILPLLMEDIIGEIIIKKKDCGFENYDNDFLLTICTQIVMAIRNQQLYQEQHTIIQGMIKSLITLLDNKIPVEYTHSKLFIQLIKVMAEIMNLNEDDRISLEYAALLHDTGKIEIPFEIITKNSELTGEEYDLMKQHPIKGADLIKHLEVLKPAVPIIMHHHEKFDGTGYPDRLKGRHIPLGSRIMAIADAFDAMISGRPYKNRIDINRAIAEIKEKSGTQFDPEIVIFFFKALENKRIKKLLKSIR